ncbi:MAG: LPP20 family lipoprotein [Thermodesulfobacteriota bacterium]|nr:LPP20 family lipoprotein [Thermodesulfobacteriota bacterium]
MRKIGFLISGIFLALMVWAMSVFASEGKEVVERLQSGMINWTQGRVTAKGSGVPPTVVTVIAQARLMAERAAKADALRNLLEAVKGVRVDADTTVENFTTKSDVVMTRVSGIVKGATVVDKRYLSDGAVEVTVAINLTGELLEVMLQELPPITTPLMPIPAIIPLQKPLPPPKVSGPAIPEVPKPSPPPAPPPPPKDVKLPVLPPPPPPPKEAKLAVPLPPAEKKVQLTPEIQAKIEEKIDLKKLDYTGLIVDARKLGLRPALVPKILNEKGEMVYSSHSLEQRELIKMGLVGYAKDVDAASKNQRVTADPYVISGLNISGEKRTDVVISNRDAQVVLTTAPYTGYLKNGRVMIVYD